MRQAVIMGLVMAWLVLQGLTSMLEAQSSVLSSDASNITSTLMSPQTSSLSSDTSGIAVLMTNGKPIVDAFIRIVFLYSPTVWTGYLCYFWLYICLPIAISTIVALLFIIRGVGVS